LSPLLANIVLSVLDEHLMRPWKPGGSMSTAYLRSRRTDAANELGLAPSTLHRWLHDGFIIAGEQLTPGAPWRIRLTDDIRALFVDDAPDGWPRPEHHSR
jgi:hypothetical protein